MPKVKATKASKIQSFLEDFPEEFIKSPNNELYCHLCSWTVSRDKLFFVESHQNTSKRQTAVVNTADPKCNCRIKAACPLDGKCKQKSIVYKAEISSNNTTKLYYGSCSTDFKARFSNHKHSFTHRNKRNATELSKEVWRAKDNGVDPAIKWSIVSTAPSYKCGGSRCNLCLAEKLAILSGDRKIMLNKRSEIMNTCRHRKKFKLKSIRLEGSL